MPLEYTAEGTLRRKRAPTRDELLDLLVELMNLPTDIVRLLPPLLFLKLRKNLEWQSLQQPWSDRQKKIMCWDLVCEGRDLGKGTVIGKDSAFEYAAAKSIGSPFEYTANTMMAIFKDVQEELPPAQRWSKQKTPAATRENMKKAYAQEMKLARRLIEEATTRVIKRALIP